MKAKKVFISYGDKNYFIQRHRIKFQAKSFNIFDDIKIYNPKNIDKTFKNRFSKVFNYSKGGGYWLWKSYLVLKTFESMNEGDILLYVDSGSTLNLKGIDRLINYYELLESSNESLLMFRIKNIIDGHYFVEKEWTTKEVFKCLNVEKNSEIKNSAQYMGGVFLAKKSNKSIEFFNSFLDVVDSDNNLITDFYNKNQDDSYFKQGRHDQSIMSVMAKIEGCIHLDDETYFFEKPERQYNYPILTVRDGKYNLWQKIKYYSLYPLNIRKIIYFGEKQHYFKRPSLAYRIYFKLLKFFQK